MKKPTDEEIEDLFARGEAARRQMQETIDRVKTGMQEREARRKRGLLRKLFSR